MKPFYSILACLFLLICTLDIKAQVPEMKSNPGEIRTINTQSIAPAAPVNELKSTWSTGQKLDSTVSEIYDNDASTFIPSEKYQYAYDDLGQMYPAGILQVEPIRIQLG